MGIVAFMLVGMSTHSPVLHSPHSSHMMGGHKDAGQGAVSSFTPVTSTPLGPVGGGHTPPRPLSTHTPQGGINTHPQPADSPLDSSGNSSGIWKKNSVLVYHNYMKIPQIMSHSLLSHLHTGKGGTPYV